MEAEREEENEGAKRVQEMVLERCRGMRGDGLLQSLEDICAHQPPSRIDKENYFFSFDIVKNRMEERVTELERLSTQYCPCEPGCGGRPTSSATSKSGMLPA